MNHDEGIHWENPWLRLFLCGSLRAALREMGCFAVLGWCSGISPSGKFWQVIKPGFWLAVRAYSRLKLTAVRVFRPAARSFRRFMQGPMHPCA
jgi:hypothetical protein